MPIGHGQGARAERAITQIMTPATYSACHTSRAMLRLRHGALPGITERLLVRLRGGAKESPSVDDSEIVREQAADSDKKVGVWFGVWVVVLDGRQTCMHVACTSDTCNIMRTQVAGRRQTQQYEDTHVAVCDSTINN